MTYMMYVMMMNQSMEIYRAMTKIKSGNVVGYVGMPISWRESLHRFLTLRAQSYSI